MKIQFCSGGHQFNGWINTDISFEGDKKVDITQPLPYADQSVDLIYCSHGVEHVTSPDALRFFKECYRILKPSGTMRICVPSIVRVFYHKTPEYIEFTKAAGFADGTKTGAVEHLITGHGHLSCWDEEILTIFFLIAGFPSYNRVLIQRSQNPELCNLEKHGEVIGEKNNEIESLIMEAYK